MFENWNSLGIHSGSAKPDKINQLIKHYGVDTVAGCETQCDWSQVDKEDKKFHNILGGEQRKASVSGYNTTEPDGPRNQMGGTAMMTIGRLSSSVVESGCDHTGLGRWSWQLLGRAETRTRVIVAYQPCKPSPTSKGYTVWSQHQRYFQPLGDFRSPRTIFYEQLIAQLLIWKAAGEEIILCGDFNENVYTGRIASRLQENDILMGEQCLAATATRLPPTFAGGGKRAIDCVYATAGIEVRSAGLLNKYGRVGDHQCFLLDFTLHSVLGGSNPRIVPAYARKLHCDCKRIRDNYNKLLGELADRHQLFKKINDITRLATLMSPAEFQTKIN